jgi:periplasmic divalent cation tolerance protein
MSIDNVGLWVGWTTLPTREQAEALARAAVEARLVACAQVEGPIASHYRWEGALERSEEYRVTLKFLEEEEEALATWIGANHPYQTPQWVAVQAKAVGEKYLKWCRDTAKCDPSAPSSHF